MIRKLIKTIFLFIVLASAVVAASIYLAATGWKSRAAVEAYVKPGSSVRSIAEELSAAGAIRTPRIFELYVRLKGMGGGLKAGTYDFPAGTTMVEAVDKLAAGDVRQYEFTIIEGWNIRDIAAALVGKPYLASDAVPADFERLAHDRDFMKELGIEGPASLEGYLFPDTYRVNYPLEARELIVRLVKHFDEVWASLMAGRGDADRIKRDEVLTLASIVEKETGAPDERDLIAGVFLNRLARGIALQSDPTIIYGLRNFDGNIRREDISNPHPYNTYIHVGLPPGPICNPGKSSLEAALAPEKTDFLYFVSKNDGSHFFSKDLGEHLKAVRRYQIVGEKGNESALSKQ